MLYDLLDRFRNFMRYRNGFDRLNKILIMILLALEIIYMITGFYPLSPIVMGGLAVVLVRFFSRKTGYADERIERIRRTWKMQKEQGKDYKFYSCKSCGRILRVPRGKGRIEIRCPICGEKIIRRT